MIYDYEIIGVVVWGGGAKETVMLPVKLGVGDLFYANSRWFKVIRVGVQESGGAATYRAECEYHQV